MRAADPEAWAPLRRPLSAQYGGRACFIAVLSRDGATAIQTSSFRARFTTRRQGRPHDCRTLDSRGCMRILDTHHYVERIMTRTTPEQNKAIVLEAFDTLFNKRDYAAAERYWSADYVQHSG